ncbi:DUF455 family protein [Helicobacter saguini]|uniref:DUF455 family protein n=1 Tax=Helicobacter saguini TaxID=1548018 RepID=A0A347VN92_9HELI|nr:ferritin-like domain-containing protein [Helicobacter saguini]MWV61856.1 DUF455 family protein [Helicobacter saguini]MWV67469.1 DUF455 family protein [Helicobacter saguini]MWV69820.1 DUF455 family protein [Helicobacter saguini]MWV72962.1 DUF455 family protein [Helicobacter saguini]TLD95657.1 ferritin-like domain-containing protein [Helicobacter saguini]
MEFFTAVFNALTSQDIESKKLLTKKILSDFDNFSFNHDSEIKTLKKPSYTAFCKVIHPTRITRIKEPNSDKSLAKLLHSIAHIEYSAIDLGLDAAYRFRHLPREYYLDFAILACEEVAHFSLLESLLHELSSHYGEFAVHDNLFNAMQKSTTLIDRMALVHKGLEALGLDSNPFVARKIAHINHALKPQILNTLETILNDEIKHVSKGVKWLKYAQECENDTRDIATILANFSEFNLIGKVPNTLARLKAGYTAKEIESLQTLRVK